MSASSSHRTRASTLCKLLPKKPSLRSKTVVNLFLNACNHPDTKDFIMDEITTNPKFKHSLSAITNKMSDETKMVHKTIRRAYALKSKGFKKRNSLLKIVSNIRSKYSIRQVQAITGMTYRQIYRLQTVCQKFHQSGLSHLLTIYPFAILYSKQHILCRFHTGGFPNTFT